MWNTLRSTPQCCSLFLLPYVSSPNEFIREVVQHFYPTVHPSFFFVCGIFQLNWRDPISQVWGSFFRLSQHKYLIGCKGQALFFKQKYSNLIGGTSIFYNITSNEHTSFFLFLISKLSIAYLCFVIRWKHKQRILKLNKSNCLLQLIWKAVSWPYI